MLANVTRAINPLGKIWFENMLLLVISIKNNVLW
jgi:hypothetical protein